MRKSKTVSCFSLPRILRDRSFARTSDLDWGEYIIHNLTFSCICTYIFTFTSMSIIHTVHRVLSNNYITCICLACFIIKNHEKSKRLFELRLVFFMSVMSIQRFYVGVLTSTVSWICSTMFQWEIIVVHNVMCYPSLSHHTQYQTWFIEFTWEDPSLWLELPGTTWRTKHSAGKQLLKIYDSCATFLWRGWDLFPPKTHSMLSWDIRPASH